MGAAMDVQSRDCKALAQQILEMAEDERVLFVTRKLSDRTLCQTIRELNKLMLSGTSDDRDMAREAVSSLGFVNS